MQTASKQRNDTGKAKHIQAKEKIQKLKDVRKKQAPHKKKNKQQQQREAEEQEVIDLNSDVEENVVAAVVPPTAVQPVNNKKNAAKDASKKAKPVQQQAAAAPKQQQPTKSVATPAAKQTVTTTPAKQTPAAKQQQQASTVMPDSPKQSSKQEDEDNAAPVTVKPSHDNVLSLFAAKSSNAAHFYFVEMLQKEQQEAQKNAKPLLTADLKQRLAERKLKIAQGKQATPLIKTTPQTPTPTSIPAVPQFNPQALDEAIEIGDASEDEKEEDSVEEIDAEKTNDEDVSMQNGDNSDDEGANNSNDDDDEQLPDLPEEEVTEEGTEAFIELGDKFVVPWAFSTPYVKHDVIALHQEIMDLYKFAKETKAEHELRDQVLTRYKQLCTYIDPKCTVDIFGSYACDLLIPGSDIDINVTSPHYARDPILFLKRMRTEITKKDMANNIKLVANARVPIISFQDKFTGQHIDISCNTKSSAALQAVQTVKQYSQQFPAFKYLVVVLKLFLRQRNLNEVFHGGLGSFALSLMVVSLLQNHISNQDASEVPTTSLGSLLIDFFALYGVYFNYETTAIDVKRQSYCIKTDIRDEDDFRLQLIDPNDASNNVSKGTSNMLGIRNAFRAAFGALTAKTHPAPTMLSRILAPSDDLVSRRRIIKF